MKLEKGFPCPHCGSEQSLTDRQDNEIKPIIPEDLQVDFSAPTTQDIQNNSAYPSPNIGVSSNIPLEAFFPPPIPGGPLPETEQKLYLQLSLEFRIILDRAKNFQEGLRNWTLLLPDRLQNYGLTRDTWDRIASIGDKDSQLQEQLKLLIRKIFL